jgi:hypothetical protein
MEERFGSELTAGPTEGWAAYGGAGRPHLAACRRPSWCGVFWCPLEPSGVVFVAVKFDSISHFDPPYQFFWNNPTENTDSPKLMEFISLNPKSLLVISFVPLYMFL